MESWWLASKSGLCIVLFLFLITVGTSDPSVSGNSSKNDTNPKPNSTTKSLIENSDKPFRCYVCSWSESANFSSEPNIDACSSYKFVPEAAAQVACDYGCQIVAYRTTKTEGLRHFHRNCLKKSDDHDTRDKCSTTYSKSFGFQETCECMANLCNEASSHHDHLMLLYKSYVSCGIILWLSIHQFITIWQY